MFLLFSQRKGLNNDHYQYSKIVINYRSIIDFNSMFTDAEFVLLQNCVLMKTTPFCVAVEALPTYVSEIC